MSLLKVNDLCVGFTQYISLLRQKRLQVIHNLEFAVDAGEVVAVIGSSGSGKSILAHAVLGILPSNAHVSGNIYFGGEELTPSRQDKLRGSEIALIPQSVQYLDPLMRVGKQVRHSVKTGDPVKAQRAIFGRYGLKAEVETMFPFQLSGGMARRVLVSTATVSGARLVIADEPTPGLDAASIKEALGQLRELADQGCAVMLITHDIESALTISDRIAVLYAGTTVEIANREDFSGKGEQLRHPYTQALWRALPHNEFVPIPGSQPLSGAVPAGCAFAPRCPLAVQACMESLPQARELRDGMVRCIHAS
ncbi:ABC transporter ATP-binding protein [Paenibacillus radicis (ex Xue et al. 2023)]|uniref:Nickel import system ATP-binding protein NikD n=1 Tax=Paenibacillus radicis (ex Xue et al. 2023) TaxID=2972489 RepID=A0ABT1YEC7_9BACL|nr:ABC transporter ATP-binding protein [Paenibacillus radicis (ex Xue et al. 2023)]MCR8631538.1 ABC transporter ATP-binding protein [Paenibacillus radicis (ex Xue et al. 2023)]